MPYQLGLDVYDSAPPPWNIYPAGYGNISTPGVPSVDRKQMVYTLTKPAETYGLTVTLDTVTAAGVRYCRWRMSLHDKILPITWSTAYALQSYPQREVRVQVWSYSLPAPPYTDDDGPPYLLRPALWGSGLDPYPARP